MQRVRAAVRNGKRRAGVPEREPICVATSATLAGENLSPDERRRETARFAADLFGNVAFNDQAVIFANRLDPSADADLWRFPSLDAEAASDNSPMP